VAPARSRRAMDADEVVVLTSAFSAIASRLNVSAVIARGCFRQRLIAPFKPENCKLEG